MPPILGNARPANPVLRRGHPLTKGPVRFLVAPVYPNSVVDLVSGAKGTASGSFGAAIPGSPWGPAPPLYASTIAGGGLTFAGRGYNGNEPAAITLFALLWLDPAGGTTSPLRTSGTSNGYAIEYSSGNVHLNLFGVANATGCAFNTGHWMGVAVGRDAAGNTFARSYDYQTGVFSSATGTLASAPVAGNGNAVLNLVSQGPLAVALAGFTPAAWSEADFQAFAADPFAPVRPTPRLAVPLAVRGAIPGVLSYHHRRRWRAG